MWYLVHLTTLGTPNRATNIEDFVDHLNQNLSHDQNRNRNHNQNLSLSHNQNLSLSHNQNLSLSQTAKAVLTTITKTTHTVTKTKTQVISSDPTLSAVLMLKIPFMVLLAKTSSSVATAQT